MFRRLALLLLLGLFAVPAAAQQLPTLNIAGPPAAEPDVRRLQAMNLDRLSGAVALSGLADPGPPIPVFVEPEGTELATSTPSWVAGFATGADGVVVVFPARVGAYPYDSLEELVQHEVAHILIDRAAGGRPVPRWLHEGIAMTAGERWGLEDNWRFAVDLAKVGEVRIDDLDRLFANPASVHHAYAVSGSFVHFLLRRHGPEVTSALLAELASGRGFAEAFVDVTGETLGVAEEEFWRRQTFWFRWLPLVSSSTVLWIGVTALALLAFVRRRQRDAELEAGWEEAEERAAAAAAERAEKRREWIH
ncbi:MAG TPA: hypothetical protein VKU40_18260 [Thermoanaerobaculia bacterium]|nr:hypothetical protein [Thermoanaerobaculia bacterium]